MDSIHIRGDKKRWIKRILRHISNITSDTRQHLQPQDPLVAFLDLAEAAPILHLCLRES